VFVAVMCAVVPYFLVRGPITRLVHLLLHRRSASPDSQAVATKPGAEGRTGQE